MGSKRIAAVLGVALAFVATADAASAATFCVAKPQCVNAGGTARASVQAAFDAAAANGPARDRVELGPRTFNGGPFMAATGNPVDVIGSGTARTVLTRTSTTAFVDILALGDPGSRASRLAVAINDGVAVEGIRTRGTAESILVRGASASAGQLGVRLDQGGKLIHSRVLLPASGSSFGVAMNAPGTVAKASTVRANTGVTAVPILTPATVRAVRLRITSRAFGFGVSSGDAVLDQATIRILGSSVGRALAVSPTSGAASLIARHVTAVGPGGASGVGAFVSSFGGVMGAPCPTAKLALRNSILRGFAIDLERTASAALCTGEVEADIDVAWSVFDPARVNELGPGEIATGKGNRNLNPRFVAEAKGNYRLRRRSPLVDRGERGKPKPGESKRDLDGRKRVLDGDGNGKARRDVGAFERKRR